jgi:hypothetical protein
MPVPVPISVQRCKHQLRTMQLSSKVVEAEAVEAEVEVVAAVVEEERRSSG